MPTKHNPYKGRRPYTLLTRNGIIGASFFLLLFPCVWFTWTIMSHDSVSSIDGFRRQDPEDCILRIHVITEPSHFNERQDIRLTWGATARDMGIELRFLMGGAARSQSSDTTWLSLALAEEQRMHYDLIQINAPGRSIRHRTFVVAGGLEKYVESLELGHTKCQYLMKVESGIFLRPLKALRVLERAEKKVQGTRREKKNSQNNKNNNFMYMGHMW